MEEQSTGGSDTPRRQLLWWRVVLVVIALPLCFHLFAPTFQAARLCQRLDTFDPTNPADLASNADLFESREWTFDLKPHDKQLTIYGDAVKGGIFGGREVVLTADFDEISLVFTSNETSLLDYIKGRRRIYFMISLNTGEELSGEEKFRRSKFVFDRRGKLLLQYGPDGILHTFSCNWFRTWME